MKRPTASTDFQGMAWVLTSAGLRAKDHVWLARAALGNPEHFPINQNSRTVRTQCARAIQGILALAIVMLMGQRTSAQVSSLPTLGSSDYENRLFPSPPAFPIEVESTSVAFFGGGVGLPATSAPFSIIRSSFGQAVESRPLLNPSTGIGGTLYPDERSLAGVKPSSISPANSVVWVDSIQGLVAAEPGLVTITWPNGESHQYLISGMPAQTSVGMYWTTTAAGGPGGPPVKIDPSINISFLWNDNVPNGTLYTRQNLLFAKNSGKGLVVLIYTRIADGSYAGREVVQVRDPDVALSQQLVVTVGTNLAPVAAVTNPGPTFYRYGLEGDPSTNFLYQLAAEGAALDGFTFVTRPTTAQNQINVFWSQTNRFGMAWPYEMDSYSASWPTDFAQRAMRFYLTETATGTRTTSPTVDLSAAPTAVIHYNDVILPGVNASSVSNLWLSGTILHASAVGRILLHYENPSHSMIGFEFVDVVANSPDNVVSVVPIAQPLAPKVSMADLLPGLATRGTVGVGGSQPSVFVSGFAGSTYQQIFPVRPATSDETEVFWFRRGQQGIVWPYEMDRFGSDWPTDFAVQSRRVYLTDDKSGNPTTSPTIDLSAVPNVQVHYNSAIPPGLNSANRSTNLWLQGHSLHASITGKILLHYENAQGSTANGFLGFQMVDVRPNTPDNVAADQPIGAALQPSQTYDTPALPGTVTLGAQMPTPGPSYVYVHGVTGPMRGLIYPVRPAPAPGQSTDIEVFWMRNGVLGVAWPYEMDWFGAAWPVNAQIFVRGDAPDPRGPIIHVPASLNANLVFQQPEQFATLTGGTVLDSIGDAEILLKYQTGIPIGSNVFFQVVHSVLRSSLSPMTSALTIGSEVTNSYQQVSTTDPLNALPAYIHISNTPAPAEDRYADTIYAKTGQIFGVNTGYIEVWWKNLDGFGIQWPSLVQRYQMAWPSSAPTIVIASGLGTGSLPSGQYPNPQLYFQNNPANHGFNPNDEHALLDGSGLNPVVYALRSDLGSAGTSLPYVLISYGTQSRQSMQVWQVLAESGTNTFTYSGIAGRQLQPPTPLNRLIGSSPQQGVSGPFWMDPTGAFWATAGGPSAPGGSDLGTNVVMHWYYKPDTSFYLPSSYRPTGFGSGFGNIPWLDLYAGTPGTPVDITTTIYWPDNFPDALTNTYQRSVLPILSGGQTLTGPTNGLPDISGQCSVTVLTQQSVAGATNQSVELIDPLRPVSVQLALKTPPSDAPTENIGGKYYFKNLPPSLQKRLYFDPASANNELVFQGISVATVTGPYLLPNIITANDAAQLTNPTNMGSNPTLITAINQLIAKAALPVPVQVNDSNLVSAALTTGVATGTGYVTLAFGADTKLCKNNDPVILEIIKVECPLYQGSVEPITPANPFATGVSMRFDGDLGGRSDKYIFDWRWISPSSDGTQPLVPDQPNAPNWLSFPNSPKNGLGANDVNVPSTGLEGLSDHWFTCRYRSQDGNSPCGTNWSDWTPPQFQQGWIARVLAGINPFNQRFQNLGDPAVTVDTTVSMIAQAGQR